MASSEAELNPHKQGNSFSESFGAYGWSEGLKTMKWITDVICVRGINNITPHAFSPMDYPDPDCPPHFYAKGKNPQWKYFKIWADYANRVCSLLSDGKSVASAGVLYHAEAEWGGAYQPFEKIVKQLMHNQIDSVVIAGDYITKDSAYATATGSLSVNGYEVQVLIVPYSQYLPKRLCEKLSRLAEEGVKILFVDKFPDRCYGGENFSSGHMTALPQQDLIGKLVEEGNFDILVEPKNTALVYRHYQKAGEDIYFFTNEEIHAVVQSQVTLPSVGPVYLYDALAEKRLEIPYEQDAGKTKIHLTLEPYQSIFVIFGEHGQLEKPVHIDEYAHKKAMNGEWQIRLAPYDSDGSFGEPIALNELGNLTAAHRYPYFAGTIQYCLEFESATDGEALLDLGRVGEIAQVWINDIEIGILICPPYRLSVPKGVLCKGRNALTVRVTNTLVKANHQNPYDRYWPQEPSGLLGPILMGFK